MSSLLANRLSSVEEPAEDEFFAGARALDDVAAGTVFAQRVRSLAFPDYANLDHNQLVSMKRDASELRSGKKFSLVAGVASVLLGRCVKMFQ
jgi:hypothetical protein